MSDYSPDKFYTHATDKKGHCVSIRTAVPPNLSSEIDTLIASRKYPDYKTPQDFVRDAVFHRLQWLNENGTIDLTDALNTWEAQIELEREADWHKLGKKIVADVNYVRMNARTEADKLRFKEIVQKALLADLPETARLELLRLGDFDVL